MADWTDERLKVMVRLHLEGWTSSMIGQRLHVTRNAVIGKLARLGYSKPKDPARQSAGARRQKATRRSAAFEHTPDSLKRPARAQKELTPPTDMPAARARGAAAATNAARFNDCRWPIGDPRTPDFRFCGAQRRSGYAYCDYHQNASEKGQTNADEE